MLEYLFVTVGAFIGYMISTIGGRGGSPLLIPIGIAAGLGSWVGKRMLGHMESKTFRRIVIVVMVLSRIALIYRQLMTELRKL